MTREEAIEFGKMWIELQEDYKDSNTYEFFKMAIEALQQEPTYTSEVAQKAYEDGKKDDYIQRKIETIDENDLKGDYVDRKEVKRIAKEMYLEVANMKLDVKTISDCISYTASKCREVFESKLQALPSAKKQEPMRDKPHIKGNYYDGFKNGLRTAEWRYNEIRTAIKKLPITDTAIWSVDKIFDTYMEESESKR